MSEPPSRRSFNALVVLAVIRRLAPVADEDRPASRAEDRDLGAREGLVIGEPRGL